MLCRRLDCKLWFAEALQAACACWLCYRLRLWLNVYNERIDLTVLVGSRDGNLVAVDNLTALF